MTTAELTAAIAGPWQDRGIAEHPYAFFAKLRRDAPVWQVPHTRTFMVTSWDLVAEAVGRPDDFSSHLTAVLITGEDGHPVEFDTTIFGESWRMLSQADEPIHDPQRKRVMRHINPTRLKPLEGVVSEVIARGWRDGLRDGRIDWMAHIADWLPMTLVARLVGLPESDVPDLLQWAYEGTDLLGGVHTLQEMQHLAASAAANRAYLVAQMRTAMLDPQDNLLGDLARCVIDGTFTEEEALGFLVIVVNAGGESTAGLIGNAARMLAERPELQQQLRANPTLIPRFLEEVLRLESPFRGHYRHVRVATSIGGVALRPNDHLWLMWAAANRDSNEFEDADEVRLDRKLGGAKHMGFGRGIHACVGAPLARLEARTAIEFLLAQTRSFSVDPDSPPVRVPSFFIRRHQTLQLLVDRI